MIRHPRDAGGDKLRSPTNTSRAAELVSARLAGIPMVNSPKPVLILMAGMPGAGKSTVALALGREFHFPVIDKDVIVSTMLEQDVPENVAHPLAYAATFDLVDHLIR